MGQVGERFNDLSSGRGWSGAAVKYQRGGLRRRAAPDHSPPKIVAVERNFCCSCGVATGDTDVLMPQETRDGGVEASFAAGDTGPDGFADAGGHGRDAWVWDRPAH